MMLDTILNYLSLVTAWGFLYSYVAFSVSIGITSYFTLYRPILRNELKDSGAFEVTNPKLSAIILIVISSLLAPMLFKLTLTGPTKAFRQTYVEAVLEDDDEK